MSKKPKVTKKIKPINPIENTIIIQSPKKINAKEYVFVLQKCRDVNKMIINTFQFLEDMRHYDIFSNHSISQCSDLLYDLHEKVDMLMNRANLKTESEEKLLDDLQLLYDKLVAIFTNFGSYHMKDVLMVLFGSKYDFYQTDDKSDLYLAKFELIEKYVVPIGLKHLTWMECSEKELSDKISDCVIKPEIQSNFECLLPIGSYSSLHQSVYGLRTIFRNQKDNRLIAMNGLVKNIPIQFVEDNAYLTHRFLDIKTEFKSQQSELNISSEIFDRWIETLTMKELLIYSTSDLIKLLNGIQNDVKYVKQNPVEKIIKHFFDMDLISRRKMIINLVIHNMDNEVQYIAYMLYDLIGSADACDGNDTQEQRKLYESFPWKLKQYFKDTLINTIEFTQESMSTAEDSQATLEQKVLLLRANEKIRDKAMVKLKDIKGKSDDQASKSKQYLEGLVKIPFGNYRKEPILYKMDELNESFKSMKLNSNNVEKKRYTLYEMTKLMDVHEKEIEKKLSDALITHIQNMKKTDLHAFMGQLTDEAPATTKTKNINIIKNHLSKLSDHERISYYETHIAEHTQLPFYRSLTKMQDKTGEVEKDMLKMNDYLDESVFGQDDAKKQILKIMGQWINGEQKGYCFGFEGSPGVGKTSLAKYGLSNCLRDKDGSSRPFSFMALGGSCNGSTLEGHNYTYVNSTWGKIVDILMESKCMNPIIYIDELDKVSRTEQGREIIGILTHLIDTTQNDEFQDRYFSGIPIDLSKVLFVFSYNDPSLIDRILLDRIHRVRFDNLSWTDKVVIVNKFMMPELNEKMGFDNTVILSDEVIRHLIDNYTMEPGVRKLKEILFDLFGEINLQLLNYKKKKGEEITLPIDVKTEDIGTTYMTKYRKIHETKIHAAPSIGTINGMWANALGRGGIIPIEVRFFPSHTFLELRLTGMQGDVMKESMNVAKTLAWSMLEKKQQKKLLKIFEDTKSQGIHIHCPEGATPKDGPSAGGAITIAIYSMLSENKIHNEISMTGEINLQGRITAIGGLESKILGSIRAGVKKILFPIDNQLDFDEFHKKYKDVLDLSKYNFHPVGTLEEAVKLVI
jgi:ATP-dependent Lon protease